MTDTGFLGSLKCYFQKQHLEEDNIGNEVFNLKLYLVHVGDGSLVWVIHSSQRVFKKHKQTVFRIKENIE